MSLRRGKANAFVLVAVVLAFAVGGSVLVRDYFPSAAHDTVTVTIESDPSGAEVVANGRSYGPTPVTIAAVKDETVTYVVKPDEPYETYDLYKEYVGTVVADRDRALKVWIPRTTAAEQAAQRAAFAEQQRRMEAAAADGRQEDGRAAIGVEALRSRALDVRRLYYRVDTTCRSGVDVTYASETGAMARQSGVSSAWYYWLVPQDGQHLYLSARSRCGSGSVTVAFVKAGQTLRESSATGGRAVATVSGHW